MKVFEFVIRPLSGFGTPLIGDTIFGQFCWQLVYRHGNSLRLEELLREYERRPFIVFSDAFPRFGGREDARNAFHRPTMPLREIFKSDTKTQSVEFIRRRKELKARRWMLLNRTFLTEGFRAPSLIDDDGLQTMLAEELRSDSGERLYSHRFLVDYEQHRNTINRLTGTTGEGGFAPYAITQSVYAPGARLSIFAGIDTDLISIETVAEGLRQIGMVGFGKDATVGLGRFDLTEYDEVSLGPHNNANACYTLSPCVPGNSWDRAFFSPFIRFGRHGGAIASSGRNPFKAPVLMVSTGAVFVRYSGVTGMPYVGRAVSGISKAEPRSVCQGYALYIPFRMEVQE